MRREAAGVGVDESEIEVSKLRRLFVDAFGAEVVPQLIPRLRLLRAREATEGWCPSPSLLLA